MIRSDLSKILEDLETSKLFRPNLTAKVLLPATLGHFCTFPKELSEVLKSLLNGRGIDRLYSHQEEAFNKAKIGQDLIIVTPTASGKTLCYNLPVLDAILKSPHKRGLYLFPTKALAQDQKAELNSVVSGLKDEITISTYDGDTPGAMRKKIRQQAQIVITNPDMLHTGILPHHTKWNDLFGNLAFIVIDEMHIYRGVFGSHMVNLLRRLRRICRHYGSEPQYICCSATIANPKEVADKLLDRDVFLIDRNGAPQGERKFYFINPPVVNKEIGFRQSALATAREVAGRFLPHGVATIIFTATRLNVEILTKYLKDLVLNTDPSGEKKIRGYRGGYLPQLRREIEKGLRSGTIKAVVSTNALELGVDIGSLEVCIICGYPGSIASTWQQAGRAGRRVGLSCTILVARNTPLDQFIIQHPDYFFGRSPEHARLNPENLSILLNHIQCAAFELPFHQGETFGETDLTEILDYLAEKCRLRKMGDKWYWAQNAYPAGEVSLRSVTAENFLIIDRSSGDTVLAEVDFESAPITVYPGAVYMIESQPYLVEDLDYQGRKAYVRPAKAEYYTEPVLVTNLEILDVFTSDPSKELENCRPGPEFNEGEVHVNNKVTGFKKLKFYTMENLGYGEISLPDQEMFTTSFWITVHSEDKCEIKLSIIELIDAMAGVGYAMKHIAAFLLMCEPRDLGFCLGDPYHNWFFRKEADRAKIQKISFNPTIFLYDAYPGGVGLSSSLFSHRKVLLRNTLAHIEQCSCKQGCPSCIGPYPDLGEKSKEFAGRLLHWMISEKD